MIANLLEGVDGDGGGEVGWDDEEEVSWRSGKFSRN